MSEEIYDPLTAYEQVYSARFNEVAKRTFAELASEAKVDVEANRATCRKVYDTEQELSSLGESLSSLKTYRVFLWIAIIGIPFFVIFVVNDIFNPISLMLLLIVLLAIILVFAYINPEISNTNSAHLQIKEKLKQYSSEAWNQMAPLNSLYDWDMFTRMISETVPGLEFDPYFTTQRLEDLKHTYGWDESFNSERSVIFSHSGLINGNPFVLCRTRNMEQGEKTYEGTKTIHWTTHERDSRGRSYTQHHSQTLYAYVTAFCPKYVEHTRLIYGNTAAPDLVFLRKQNGLASKVGSSSYKKKLRELNKKARDLSNSDFAMLTNEEFEVAFDTSNRNHNQQFALLFTPLAQESMLKLLRDGKLGYGDDFDFLKKKMVNTIVPAHLQGMNLDMNPKQYRSFDYDKAQRQFFIMNEKYFRAIYFSFAPLLCIPMYQQIRPHHEIYGRDMERRSAFWEHEALANFWGDTHFKHPKCVTPCILKTQLDQEEQGNTKVMVHAYGFRTEQRVEYVQKWGSDGKIHSVPVYWDEYIPVKGSAPLYLREDNSPTVSSAATHRERVNHINKVLEESQLKFYRRHIASGV